MSLAQPTPAILRFVVPSVGDLIFLSLFCALLAGPLSNRPLADADIGWHIRTGELIMSAHSVPRTDPFSSTMQGQRWFAWEWLYDILLAVLHRAAGLNAVVWLAAILIASTFAFLFRQLLRRGTGLPLAIVLMLLSECASTIHLFARPHIVSWLFTLLWFAALERMQDCDRQDGDQGHRGKVRRWIPYFFPVSMLLWVNLHGGWLFGLALVGVYAIAAFVESVRAKDPFAGIRAGRQARLLAVVWLASAGATLANPFGWQLHIHIYRYLSDHYLINHIDEFRSPDFHGSAQRCFAVILILTIVALTGKQKRLRLSHVLVILLAVYTGFYSARNLPMSSMLLVLIGGPMLWESFSRLGEKSGGWQVLRIAALRTSNFSNRMGAQEMQLRGHLWPVLGVAFAFAICLNGGWIGSHQIIQAGFDSKQMPAAAVSYLQGEVPTAGASAGPAFAPIFSVDSWGGYLIYRMYPERKVVFDDRHDLYGPERVRQYIILTHVEPGWEGVLADWKIQTALLPSGSTLANLLREIPGQWRIVYEDKVATVFEKH